MKKYKKVIINLAILTFLLSAGATTAYANSDEYSDNNDIDINKRAKILETFEDGDYGAWKSIVGHKGVLTGYIGQEQFNKFIQARELARNGKYSKALALSNELQNEIKQLEKNIREEKNNKGIDKDIVFQEIKAEMLKKKLKKIS